MGAFLLGLGLGMIGGVLMAPRPGKHYRAVFGAKASEGMDYLMNKTEGIRDSATGAVEKGREAMSRHIERIATTQQPAEVYTR